MTGTSPKNILVTGLPGCGKTTLVRRLAAELREFSPVGFCTAEMREHGARAGLELLSLAGAEAGAEAGVLAHVDIRGPHRVGKYGVDLRGFERFLAGLRLPAASSRLVMIDEIGKMECLSVRFRDLVVALLDGPVPLIATIALKAGGFIEAVKRRGDVRIFEVTERKREGLLADIAGRIRALPPPGDPGSR